MADSFSKSPKARAVDFCTNENDTPLIAQFGARNSEELCAAAEHAISHVDGIDVNCGCPQKWALKEGIGASLIERVEVMEDMVKSLKRRLCSERKSVSVKVRIHEDARRSVEMCRRMQAIGVDFIAIHGRTVKERNSPVHVDVLKTINDSLQIPVIANGGVKSHEQIAAFRRKTSCAGVMIADACLTNPAIFAHDPLPVDAVIQDWMNLYQSDRTLSFANFHNHTLWMIQSRFRSKAEKVAFTNIKSTTEVQDALLEMFPELCLDVCCDIK